jgi:hypothetical protein
MSLRGATSSGITAATNPVDSRFASSSMPVQTALFSMETSTLAKYLRFLVTTAEQVASKDPIDFYGIAGLRSEIARFYAQLDGQENVSTAIAASLRELQLHVDDRWLDGSRSKRGFAFQLLRFAVWRSPAGHVLDEQTQDRVRTAVQDFRNRADHLRFALDP